MKEILLSNVFFTIIPIIGLFLSYIAMFLGMYRAEKEDTVICSFRGITTIIMVGMLLHFMGVMWLLSGNLIVAIGIHCFAFLWGIFILDMNYHENNYYREGYSLRFRKPHQHEQQKEHA